MKQMCLNTIQLTNQTELLHWIISPEDDVVFDSYSQKNIKQHMKVCDFIGFRFHCLGLNFMKVKI